jgi:hypothetical protein
MSTLGIMKERIASEMRLDDLSSASEFRVLSTVSDIHDAIMSAIDAYADEKFYFSESRSSVSFNTVAAQDSYTSSDDADIARILKIQYAFVTIGGQPQKLLPRLPEEVEAGNLGSGSLIGTPQFYTWYAETIRLEPIPSDVFPVRFGCILKTAAPASDAETGNRWMVDAERLIRCRAKAELYAHVIKDTAKATDMAVMAAEALQQLINKTNNMTQPESVLVEAWNPYA